VADETRLEEGKQLECCSGPRASGRARGEGLDGERVSLWTGPSGRRAMVEPAAVRGPIGQGDCWAMAVSTRRGRWSGEASLVGRVLGKGFPQGSPAARRLVAVRSSFESCSEQTPKLHGQGVECGWCAGNACDGEESCSRTGHAGAETSTIHGDCRGGEGMMVGMGTGTRQISPTY
jgi:hypothetical protein